MNERELLCPSKDVFERMNFLYQAGQIMTDVDHVTASTYGNMMMNCAKKLVLRVEPELKRTICKKCQVPLIAGETARVRLISKPLKAVKWTCLLCKTTRKIPTQPGYKLWPNEPDAVVKIFDYSSQSISEQKTNNGNNKKSNENIDKQNDSKKT